jgi:hypothetical protein
MKQSVARNFGKKSGAVARKISGRAKAVHVWVHQEPNQWR